MHEVSHCLSVGNKANGFYTNHHLGGIKFDHNTAYKNGSYNYSFVNRKGSSLDDAIDMDGYGHIVTHNISYKSSKIVKSIDINQCTILGNSFSYINQTWINETLNDDDFYSLSLDELTAARNTDGSLPTINFMRLKDESKNFGYGTFNPDTSTTGIGSTIINSIHDGYYYTLDGKRQTHPLRNHIYIHNGKKIIKK